MALFTSSEAARDHQALMAAIDAASTIVPCVQTWADAFFPDYEDDYLSVTNAAKAMCASCPVRVQCAEYGMKHEVYGIWGGITEGERRRVRRSQNRRLPDEDVA